MTGAVPEPVLRFEFGANWQSYVSVVDDDRIDAARRSLIHLVPASDFAAKSFLDVGCGSGLFSLAAKRLGARVHSFDFDVRSVQAAERLKASYFPGDPEWVIEQGSVLDERHMESLGRFDIVYAWGVLHHTGNMAEAIRLASRAVKEDGSLVLAIYNDQGAASRRWHAVKRLYNRSSRPARVALVFLVASLFESRWALGRFVSGQNPFPLDEWRRHKQDRGMSVWHDWVDWCGGLPFEVAKPEDVFARLRDQGLVLEKLRTCLGGWGCNEYVARRR